jgi:sulfur carrier protein
VGVRVKVRVKILGNGEREIEVPEGATVETVLRRMGLLSTEYVVVKSGRVIAEDEAVSDGDELILYPVVSGG